MKGLTITNTTDQIVDILIEHNGTTEMPHGVLPGHSIEIGDIDTSESVVVRTRNDGWPPVWNGRGAAGADHRGLESYVRDVLRVVVQKLGDKVDGHEEQLSKLPKIVGSDAGSYSLDAIVTSLLNIDKRLSALETRTPWTLLGGEPLRVTCALCTKEEAQP